MNSREVAELFLRDIWKLHGTPEKMVSDQGTQFNSKFMWYLYKWLGIMPSFSLAYHPLTDGQAKWVNQLIKHFLHGYINHEQDNWVQFLPMPEFAYNNAKHSSTGISLFQAVYGRDPTITPSGALLGSPKVDDHAEKLRKAQEDIQSSLQLSKE
jgi:transposase InsO family protein